MPVNNYSVGRDLTFTISMPTGVLTISGITDYSSKKKTTNLNHKGLNGKMTHGVIPDGWEITIKLDRKDPTLDRYFASRDADYYNGINAQGGIVYENIAEADGTVSQYRYTEVVLSYDGGGDWKGDAYVPITIMAYATERQQVV